MSGYGEFLDKKTQLGGDHGFGPVWMPDFLFDFQKHLVEWASQQGRAALYCDCGMGKTPMQLVWAENVRKKTNRNVLVATPLAVSHQTIQEGEKFGVECTRSINGEASTGITVTNYEKLHLFDPNDFAGVVCDESSILKNFDGKRRRIITRFMTKLPYRLLCTATAAPNDYSELGTSSEALGALDYSEMLERFFKNTQNICNTRQLWVAHGGPMPQWVFKKHAEDTFWKWMCSWSRAMRRPSDFGFDDGDFILPELIEQEHFIDNTEPPPGELFVRPAFGLSEQRAEKRATINERCELAASLVDHNDPAVCWCDLNDEGDLLEKLIPDAVQVSGSDSDEKKEAAFLAFSAGDIRVMVTKPKIGALGLNWQHCAHQTFFPSHSYEQYYQGTRRSWRFGQTRPVTIDIITTGGSMDVLKNLKRKAAQADKMFSRIVGHMNESMRIDRENELTRQEKIPTWL